MDIILTVIMVTLLDNGLTIRNHRTVEYIHDMQQCEYLARAARDVKDSDAVEISVTTKCEVRSQL